MLFSGIIERFYNKQIVKLMFAIINIYSQILRPSYSRPLTIFMNELYFQYFFQGNNKLFRATLRPLPGGMLNASNGCQIWINI